ncbi:hypothetical protein EJ06DRAFT_152332 [Trichodelitschia bisporula]|uniref:RAVE subunit 2/Rogdi n=1 Tax=Trichodelitschia bisporula TaxID=703511 RepID=A0A6G1HNS8_9PEZI|nr:hypothetical protein EJ06DRAFT_152332 [Trichodelitschia bisporula]
MMSTIIWPPIAPAALAAETASSLARELDWLLAELQDTLQSLKAGLSECAALLAPSDTPSTLALSSHRSEALKGYVTRVGTHIVKGDVKLRLGSLPPPKGLAAYPLVVSGEPGAPVLALQQLAAVRSRIDACLDVVDVSTWAGDAKDAGFIAGQMRLLDVNLAEAKRMLKGEGDVGTQWWQEPVDYNTFDPPLPSNVSFHLSIVDAALRLEIRTLEPATPPADYHSAFSLNRLAVALGTVRVQHHDELGQTFTYKGHEVKVREKIRVESQDPNLMSALAKLNALERGVGLGRKALDIAMGRDGDE